MSPVHARLLVDIHRRLWESKFFPMGWLPSHSVFDPLIGEELKDSYRYGLVVRPSLDIVEEVPERLEGFAAYSMVVHNG